MLAWLICESKIAGCCKGSANKTNPWFIVCVLFLNLENKFPHISHVIKLALKSKYRTRKTYVLTHEDRRNVCPPKYQISLSIYSE